VLAKAGNLELYDQLRPNLNMNQVMFHDDDEYKPVVIDTPFLLPKQGEEPTPDQKTFIDLSEKFVSDPSQKTMVVRSRYGSGKTYYLQQLIKKNKFQRVLFITYRQTLARDIDRNFKKLGFKNYLDAPEHPEIWNANRLNCPTGFVAECYK
jgi:superfamily II DNA or RNA helicase